MWTIKYKPTKIEEVIGLPNSVKNNLNDDMKHMFLISKTPGTGKTTTADIIEKTMGCQVLRLNGSDKRGIDVVRNTIKEFAMSNSINGKFKIVRLEESDRLTVEAQDALREITEIYEKNCRFIFTANHKKKFEAALLNRGMVIDFSKIKKEPIIDFLKTILQKENVSYEDGVVEKVVDKYHPSVRGMINKLEELSKNYDKILCGHVQIQDENILEFIKIISGANKETAPSKLKEGLKWCINSGFEALDILWVLRDQAIYKEIIPENKLVKFIEALGDCEALLQNAVDDDVQLSAGIVRLMKVMV